MYTVSPPRLLLEDMVMGLTWWTEGCVVTAGEILCGPVS